MWSIGRVLKYGVLGTSVIGTGVSLHANDYNINSIGIVRLGRAAITVYKIGLTYKKELYYRDWPDHSAEDYLLEKSRAHKLAADKLLKLICVNKGVYIKVGQHIGALDYLLPKEFVETMKVLHSNAPQNPVEDLYKVIRQDLKRDPEELFSSFDPEPLGTASLAQVHRATLKDGREVAVKVQHPYVLGNSKVDMKTMECLCKIMSSIFPDFKMQWLVEESKKNLPIELDFLHEGVNAEKIRALLSNYKWLKIPKIHWDLSTKRVLVMEYLDGGQVNNLEYIKDEKINKGDVINKLGILYSNMIFINGFVHSDPHPGNILIKKNNENGDADIILLDHGLYADLTNNFMYNYSKLWLSILNVDRPAMRHHCTELGIKGELYGLFACMLTGRPWESVIQGINKVQHNDQEKELLQKGTSLVLPHIADILDQVDRQMLLVLKTNDLLRGIESTLDKKNYMQSFLIMSKCCVENVYKYDINNSNKSKFNIFLSNIMKNWLLFKMNIYYFYLGICNYGFFNSMKMLM